MKRKLLLTMVALLSIVGVRQVHAYTVEDLKSAGWTSVTDLESLALNDYYFILVDGQESLYSLSNAAPKIETKAVYQTLENPFIVAGQVWILEKNDDSSYALKSLVDGWYYNTKGGEGWAPYFNETNKDSKYTFTLEDGKYVVANAANNNSTYLGPYKDSPTVDLSHNDGLLNAGDADPHYTASATNKGKVNAPGYYVYSMSRTNYDAKRIYSKTLENSGWTALTSVDGLGKHGYYYAFLDATENGGESGFAMTGTGGRPKYKYLAGDPTENTTQMWTMEAYGSGYALKNVSDSKYIYSAASWNMQATETLTANAEYRPASLENGTWTISSVTSTEEFLGNYKNSPYNPTDGEDLASNKSAGKGKRTFLIYSIPTIAGVAAQLPEGGAMEADKWYYIDIAIAGKYNATSSELQNIVYTTDGSVLVRDGSTITNAFAAIDNELEVARYYVKSSTATVLTVDPASFEYVVGSATANIEYVQAGNTVTISYSELATNNPNAAVATNLSAVTFSGGSITCAATENGFTFTVPEGVAANTEYTLTIPANAIGYEVGNTYNEAQTITLKTPAVFDGTYFFRVESTFDGKTTGTSAAVGKYLARGKSNGTHATIDAYGLPIIVATDGKNNTTLSPADTKRFYYHTSGWESWADAASVTDAAKFDITLNEGVYKIHSLVQGEGIYFKYNDKNVDDESIEVYDDGDGTNSGPIINWALETLEEHAIAMQNKKDAQAAASAAAAYASGNYASLNGIATVEALEAELEKNYIQGYFKAPTEIASVQEKYQGVQPASAPEKVYSANIDITEPGFYKFSMQAFYRAASNPNTQELHSNGADFPPVVLFFGDSETQIKSLYEEEGLTDIDFEGDDFVEYEGTYYPNRMNPAKQTFAADKFHNDVWVYISEPGEYEYGVKYMGYANQNMQWFIYSPESVTINSYAAAADDTDYANLAAAIATAKANAEKLGFDEGEYAPYNNTTVVNAIPAAEEIDTKVQNSKLVVLSAIKNLENWTVNETEVNAIYNPTFALSENNMTAIGWINKDGFLIGNETGEYHSRAMVGDEKLKAFNDTKSALYLRYDDRTKKETEYEYGSVEGYTMPLNKNIYQFTAQVGGWNAHEPIIISVVNSDDEVIATTEAVEITEDNDLNKNVGDVTTTPVDVNLLIPVSTPGDYKLVISNGNTAENNAIVISNLSLLKAVNPTVEVAITKAGYTTFSSEYAVDLSDLDAVEAYYVTASDIHSDYVTLTPAEGIVEAGQGLIFKGEADTYNIPVALEGLQLEGNLLVPGEGKAVKEGSYVFSWDGADPNSAGFYHVGDVEANVPVGKAYLPASDGTYAKILYIGEGNATAIETTEAVEADADGALYNVAGQQVGRDYKGIVIKNGKKYLNK